VIEVLDDMTSCYEKLFWQVEKHKYLFRVLFVRIGDQSYRESAACYTRVMIISIIPNYRLIS
jgi:hypothetical protein